MEKKTYLRMIKDNQLVTDFAGGDDNLLSKLEGQALHAQTLGFIHPTKKKWVEFKSSLAPDFKKVLDLLNNLSG